MSTRLKPYTDNTPKCLLKINNIEIIFYILHNLIKNNIKNIIFVTGFLNYQIEIFIKNNYSDLNYTFIYNKDYQTTNNAFSLLLTEKYINEDFILLDSDIIFSNEIIPLLFNQQDKGIRVAVKRHELSDEEIKVKINDRNKILSIGKEIKIEEAYGESIGIEYFPFKFKKSLFATLHKRIITENRINEFYEASFQEMIENDSDFYCVDIKDLEAIEIDFIEDLKLAEKIIYDKKIFTGI